MDIFEVFMLKQYVDSFLANGFRAKLFSSDDPKTMVIEGIRLAFDGVGHESKDGPIMVCDNLDGDEKNLWSAIGYAFSCMTSTALDLGRGAIE